MSDLNERIAKEVMGWPVLESANLVFDKPEVACLITGNSVLRGTPYRLELGVEKWLHSWKEWGPDKNIVQAFRVIGAVLAWDWHDNAWFEMAVGGGDPIVEFRCGAESVVLHLGINESLARTICVVALEATRKRDDWG